jgi:hypothetical protein
MHFFSAARPRALVSTGYYPDLHLKYNDVLFALVRRRDGAAKFTIVLTQRWRKGEKEKVAEKWVIIERWISWFWLNGLRILWPEEDEILNFPVHHFLALAFADQVFTTLASRADLEAEALDDNEDIRIYPYKPECANRPFLVDPKGKPLHYQRLWYMLGELSYRSGYLEHIRPYDIRRGTSNKLDGMQNSPRNDAS